MQGFYGTINQNQVTAILGPLRRSLIGMDPLSIDTIWNKLYLGNNHGYAGDFMEGLSSIDICLWDLKGKFCDMPVYKLLGGSRTTIDCYASALRFSVTSWNTSTTPNISPAWFLMGAALSSTGIFRPFRVTRAE